MKPWLLIIVHQLVFQGMFIVKNVMLSKKLGVNIRGSNPEAILSTVAFASFIIIALGISYFDPTIAQFQLLDNDLATVLGIILAGVSVVISGAALMHLSDSWRVGVIEEQRTELITTGIYRFSRNPYFLSYSLMFFSYTILLQNAVLLFLSIACLFLIHKMVMKEEQYLFSVHGESFLKYKRLTPRYW